MNIVKNMEAIFLVATALVLVHGYATAAIPTTPHAAKLVASAAPMQVVTIVGKRLSAAEKAQ